MTGHERCLHTNAAALTDILDRLDSSQKACFDADQHIAAMDIQSARAALASLLSAPAVSTGKPVAWRWKPRLSSTWIYNPEKAWLDLQDPAEINIEPLYPAPASGDGRDAVIEAAASIALTDEETVARAMYDWQFGAGTWDSSQSSVKDHYVGLARVAISSLSLTHYQPMEVAAVIDRNKIEKALCCPGGCVRTDDCFVDGDPRRWGRSKHEREQAHAIMGLIALSQAPATDAAGGKS